MDLSVYAKANCVALFDLDGTLTWHDTLFPFLAGFVARHPRRWPKLWRAPCALLAYLGHRDRGRLKAQMIAIAMGGESRTEVDAWADRFVAQLRASGRFRAQALQTLERHRAAAHKLVLLSASPDLYVPRIGILLGFERTVCTEITWQGQTLDGRLKTRNRRGEEKTQCLEDLRRHYPGCEFVAYGNSASDLDHMRGADDALLVNADRKTQLRAAALHIDSANWV